LENGRLQFDRQFGRRTSASINKDTGKVKVKATLEQVTEAYGEVEVQPYSFFNLGVRVGGWSTSRPGHFTPGKEPVPIL
jgi:hypothetical protein